MKYGNQFSVVKSFYDWCVENNRMDLNDRFDEEKNCCTTKDVGYQSNQKWWFKCEKLLHDSEEYYMCFVTRSPQRRLSCRKCNSLAQSVIDKFGEEYFYEHWHSSNVLDPWNISRGSKAKVIIQCDKKDYHVYEQDAASFAKGIGCPYCINRVVHPNDSLASVFPEIIDRWSSKNTKSPYEYSPHSEQKVWFKCPAGVHDDYQQKIANAVIYEFRCRQCSIDTSRVPEDLTGQKFGRLTAVSLDTDTECSLTKEGHTRYRWWCKCDCGNPDLKSVLACHLKSHKIQSCGCIRHEECSQLQFKVEKYIIDNYDCKITHEYNCGIIAINPSTGRQLPYDNEIIFSNGKKMIVEVMGESHYKVDLYTRKNAKRHGFTPEEELQDLQRRDEHKKDYAILQGYSYLAIPYWTEYDETYEQLISDAIHKILNP